jgi:WD40 repeat protein
VDAACLRFEAAWQAGQRPRLEEFLDAAPESECPALLRELLHLEWEYRRRGGEDITPHEYRLRFPHHAALIEQVFTATGPPRSGAGSPPTVPGVELPPGSIAAGPPAGIEWPQVPGYEILGVLGRGGMGIVYKARQLGLERVVALKMILQASHASAEERQRFHGEAQAVARLQHPHIVQIYEVGEHQGWPYFSLEFCAGGNLDQKLDGTPLAPLQAAHLVEALARATHVAHGAGIVHRDLKPANVLLTADGAPKIADFGLARRLDVAGQTRTGAVLGTPSYMAPEQAGKAKEATPAADTYALGAILYELLTGRPPFKAATDLDTVLQVASQEPVSVRRLQPRTPKNLETICHKCLEKDPKKRYTSAAALAEDLRRFQAGEPIAARPAAALERVLKWVQRRPAVAALVAVVLLTAAAGFAGTLAQWRQAEAARADADARADAEAAAHRQAQEALDESQQRLYTANMSLAEREWNNADTGQVLRLLDRCPAALRRWEWHYLDGLCHAALLTLRGHADRVSAVAYSPDGQRLASASLDGTVRIWDPATGQELHTLRASRGAVHGVAFADGSRLASAHQEGVVVLWDAATGQQLRTFRGHKGKVYSVAFRGHGQQCASAGQDQTVRIWDLDTGHEVHTLRGHTRDVTCVAYSPDGQWLASGSLDRTARVWHAGSGREQAPLHHGEEVCAVAFHPDSQRLASAGHDNRILLWDAATGRNLRSFEGHRNGVLGLSFSPDRKRLASTSQDFTVVLWDLRHRPGQIAVFRGHRNEIGAVAFSPDGRRLASGGSDQTVKVWDATRYLEVDLFTGHLRRSDVFRVRFSPNSRHLATASGHLNNPLKPGEIKVWDVATRTDKEVRTLRGGLGPILSVAYSPDGQRLVSGDASGAVKVWGAADGKELLTLRGRIGQIVFDVAFSQDGRRIAAASGWPPPLHSQPGEVKIWDAQTGKEIRSWRGHQGAVGRVVFGPEDRFVASAGADQTIKIWDPNTGVELRTLRGHTDTVVCLALSRDGRRLASGSGDLDKPEKPGEVRIWDVDGGAQIAALEGHRQMITDVGFSPDGDRLLSSSRDGTVRLWDLRTGQQVFLLPDSANNVLSAAFSPNGRWIAAGNYSGRVTLWDSQPGDRPAAAPGKGGDTDMVWDKLLPTGQ